MAAIVLLVIGFSSVGVASRPSGAVPLLLLVEMASAASYDLGPTVGQLHVIPRDILALVLGTATLIRSQQRGIAIRPPQRLVLLLAILFLSMVRGVAAFGVEQSLNAAREMLGLLTAAVFFSTVRVTPRLVRTVRNWLLVSSTVLVVGAVSFWVQRGFGTYAATGERALNGLQALIVLETTLAIVLFPPFRGRLLRWAGPLAGAVVVVLSTQRTVWAAGVVAAAVLVVANRRGRGAGSAAAPRLLVLAAGLGVVLVVAAGPPGATSDITAGIERTSSSQDSTFSWRLEGWSALIDRQTTGPRSDLAVGSPSGTGEDRIINGARVTVAAHSGYVSTLTMTGILGVILLMGLHVAAIRRSRQVSSSPSSFVGRAALLFTALLALQLVYFVGYSTGSIAGIVLGLACGFVHGERSANWTRAALGPRHPPPKSSEFSLRFDSNPAIMLTTRRG